MCSCYNKHHVIRYKGFSCILTMVAELLAKLQLEDLDLILRERRLRWFGHVACSSGAIRTAYDMQIDGKGGGGGREAQANMEETDRERLP